MSLNDSNLIDAHDNQWEKSDIDTSPCGSGSFSLVRKCALCGSGVAVRTQNERIACEKVRILVIC